MEIILATIVGTVIGFLSIALAKPRKALGDALLPSLGAISALLWWVAATWISRLLDLAWLHYDQIGSWIGTVVVSAAVCVTVASVVSKKRNEIDEDLFDRLSHRSHLNVKP